jgi:O-methyltransferase involved in polyketide biosynthesis
MVEKNRSWFFGIDPANVADFLDRFGWRLEEHLGYDDLADRYVKPTGRALLSTQLERMVFAVKS